MGAIHENEIIMSVAGLGLLIFILLRHHPFKTIPSSKLLLAGFCVIVAGWVLRVAEGFIWANLLNYLEHTCYAVSSILVALWCRRTFKREKEKR